MDNIQEQHHRPVRLWDYTQSVIIAAVLSLCVVIVIALSAIEVYRAVVSPDRGVVTSTKDYTLMLKDCSTRTLGEIHLQTVDIVAFERVWILCGNQLYNLDFLEDFDIRREKLLRQELDERVILWMVVAITVSGVILSGLQLLASYKLGQASQISLSDPSQISLEWGKLSLKSSVTGLLILVVSLAFFIVYVKWVYTIQDVNLEKPGSLTATSYPSGQIAGYGRLAIPDVASRPAAGPAPSAPTGAKPLSNK